MAERQGRRTWNCEFKGLKLVPFGQLADVLGGLEFNSSVTHLNYSQILVYLQPLQTFNHVMNSC